MANETIMPEPPLTWYDVNGQWLDPDSCNYGSGQDQMTMTYVSFTGYLRYILIKSLTIHDFYTRIMVRVGQSVWDDIKILGPQVGHLISIS